MLQSGYPPGTRFIAALPTAHMHTDSHGQDPSRVMPASTVSNSVSRELISSGRSFANCNLQTDVNGSNWPLDQPFPFAMLPPHPQAFSGYGHMAMPGHFPSPHRGSASHAGHAHGSGYAPVPVRFASLPHNGLHHTSAHAADAAASRLAPSMLDLMSSSPHDGLFEPDAPPSPPSGPPPADDGPPMQQMLFDFDQFERPREPDMFKRSLADDDGPESEDLFRGLMTGADDDLFQILFEDEEHGELSITTHLHRPRSAHAPETRSAVGDSPADGLAASPTLATLVSNSLVSCKNGIVVPSIPDVSADSHAMRSA